MYRVAFGNVVIPLAALAVDLDALEADILLQQGLRQQGNGLADEAVQPLAGVIPADRQFFLEKPSFPEPIIGEISANVNAFCIDKRETITYNIKATA